MSDDGREEPARVRLGNKLLLLVEDAVYVSIAVLLSLGALVLVIQAGGSLLDGARGDSEDALIDTLDRILVIFIFVELLYAVRVTLKERRIVVEPFLVVGILASIKEIIVLSVKGANEYVDQGPEFARAMTEIGILGGMVLLLAGTAILLRRRDLEDSGLQGGPPT